MEQCEILSRVRNSSNAQQELNCYLNEVRVMPKTELSDCFTLGRTLVCYYFSLYDTEELMRIGLNMIRLHDHKI